MRQAMRRGVLFGRLKMLERRDEFGRLGIAVGKYLTAQQMAMRIVCG